MHDVGRAMRAHDLYGHVDTEIFENLNRGFYRVEIAFGPHCDKYFCHIK